MSAPLAPATAPGLALGVIVPCRDEARTLERKLANLARCRWPAAARPHHLLVVDDGSADGTRALAERLLAAWSVPGVAARCIANRERAGKPGAIASALAELHAVDLCVLTDADVVLDEGALVALAQAFEREPELALASGAQHFVASLAPDGTLRSAELGALVDASTAFDRWTARVRRAESRCGRLFSVHGELLAWRAALALRPTPGVAADDLDLCLQVRARADEPRRVRRVAAAAFHELKTPPGPVARAQALRRARAWFQAVERAGKPWQGALEYLQWSFYRHAPALAPRLTWMLPLATLAAALLVGAGGLEVALGLVWLMVFSSPPGWRWLALMRVIAAARAAERAAPLADRWEMPRA